MKRLQHIFRRRLNAAGRSLRRVLQHFAPVRVLLIVEATIACSLLLFVLTGSRAGLLDGFGPRADLAALITLLVIFGLLHLLLKRRLMPALNRRFLLETYDERSVLFDLGQAAHASQNVDQLYRLIVKMIEDALQTENVTIFIRDDLTGNFICRESSAKTFVEASPAAATAEKNEPTGNAERSLTSPLMLTRNSFIAKRLSNLSAPLGLEPRDFEIWERAFASAAVVLREQRERECATLRGIKSRLLLPIKRKRQLIGILSIGPRQGARTFSAEDKRMLMSVAGQMAFIIENAKLAERTIEEERLRGELAVAAEVQQRLFPAREFLSPSLDLSGFCQPAREVGGDYYDFLNLDNGQTGIAVADVAGKGISAALLMSIVQASLRSQAMSQSRSSSAMFGVEGSLAGLVAAVNRLLCRSCGAGSYVTFFYAQFDELTGRLTYVNAGHNPPLLIRTRSTEQHEAQDQRAVFSNRFRHTRTNRARLLQCQTEADAGGVTMLQGTVEDIALDGCREADHCIKLTTGGPVIGVFDDRFYEQETIQMESGDLLVAYTDGVTEALNPIGEEFGEARLQETLVASAHLPANEVRECVVRRVREWCGSAPQHDDLTFVVVKVK